MRHNKMTTEEFIARSKSVWGENTFDYSKTVYTKWKDKVMIRCPIHGQDIVVRPNNHIYRHSGCHKCNHQTCVKKQVFNQDFFLRRAREAHGNKYDYSKVVYQTAIKSVLIGCPVHTQFWQKPTHHWKGSGCPQCGNDTIRQKMMDTAETFAEKAKRVHGDRYDYSKTKYIRSQAPVNIICRKHGEFICGSAARHLTGTGCQKCRIVANSGVLSTNYNDGNSITHPTKKVK